ncbi:MAG: ADP-forming succinate--CoA ligase subunit beta [Acidobacteria bacterium]|nr:ADP-forming succinate--CoA ligase subunit beta [Acidobacteriota bacterium]
MDLFEYQGKSLFARLGVPVPEGRVARTPEEARTAAEEIGGKVVVKAQVQVGGRGKAGGIKLADGPDQAFAHATDILGMDIKGHTVDIVWVEQASNIAAEYYVSFTLDRSVKKHLAIVSAQGGMDIEAVAADTPEAVVKMHIDPVVGLTNWQASELVYRAKLDRATARKSAAALRKLYEAFVSLDCDLVEVNPLILTDDGEIVALDSKVTLDSNAFFRHPDFEDFRSAFTEDPMEKMARQRGLNFIKLDGSVGIIGNGAGLVMSTLDVVALVGGAASNFLDVGGGAGADTITNALEVLTKDPTVKSVLINIFGGITRCDLVAQGIVEALEGLELQWPIVVRLDGTNAVEGREILRGVVSDAVIPVETMREAAEKAVELAGKG